MRTTLANGQVANIIARTWDGAAWKELPERILIKDIWWVINYIIYSGLIKVMFPMNIDGTAHFAVSALQSLYWNDTPYIV